MSQAPARGHRRDRGRVFSERLDELLGSIGEGETPNFGVFCAYCYNPLPAGFERCDYCGRDVQTHPTVQSVPLEVIDMHQHKLKRESLVVNSFAYLGLGLGLAIFLALVAVNVLLLNKALWFFILGDGDLPPRQPSARRPLRRDHRRRDRLQLRPQEAGGGLERLRRPARLHPDGVATSPGA